MRERRQHREFCNGRLVQVVTQKQAGDGPTAQWIDGPYHWLLDGRRVPTEAEALEFRKAWGE